MRAQGGKADGGLRRACDFGQRRENRDRQFVDVGKFAGAGDGILAACDVARTCGARGRDSRLELAGGERGVEAAGTLDILKKPPGCFAQAIRQGFEGSGAGGGIRNPPEV